jgi:uncharacterized protein YutE (UPF0331/DUF86 family)
MRLTQAQQEVIRATCMAAFKSDTHIWLYGSRLNDAQRGGDIDLYVETGPHRLMDELRCKIRQHCQTSGTPPMSEHIALIRKKIDHLSRMQGYLAYSLAQTQPLIPIIEWLALTPDQHETLAAFRVRFSEFQEQLGKAMRAIAREEEQNTEPFSSVLLYMEKLGILDSVEQWKLLRELRNAVNHEYEENSERLSEFFQELVQSTPRLFQYFDRLVMFCDETYGR